jgi:hypothetical protein
VAISLYDNDNSLAEIGVLRSPWCPTQRNLSKTGSGGWDIRQIQAECCVFRSSYFSESVTDILDNSIPTWRNLTPSDFLGGAPYSQNESHSSARIPRGTAPSCTVMRLSRQAFQYEASSHVHHYRADAIALSDKIAILHEKEHMTP